MNGVRLTIELEMYSRLPRQKYIQKIAKAARISTDLVLSLERSPRIVMLVHEAVDALLAGVSLSSWTSPSTSSSPVQMPSSSFTNTFSFTPTLFDITTAQTRLSQRTLTNENRIRNEKVNKTTEKLQHLSQTFYCVCSDSKDN